MYYKVKGKARNNKRKQEIIRENNKTRNMVSTTLNHYITAFTHSHLLNKLSLASRVKGDKPWTVTPSLSVNMFLHTHLR